MSGIDVASVVASIISAFGSGMNIFHRLGGKKRKSPARPPRPSEEEEWLQHSLTRRPLEIRTEYDQSVARFGRRFETGDDVAHSSLAHTLLVLNTGLINLINHALSGDSKSTRMSRKALFNLSEAAAVDTMAALGQLNSRLMFASQLSLSVGLEDNGSGRRRHKERHDTLTSRPKQVKPPPPAPLLVRGGWVRSKSGSSVVSATEARKASEEKAEKHQRSKSDSTIPKLTAATAAPPAHRSTEGEIDVASRIGENAGRRAEDVGATERHRGSEQARPQRPPSMLIVPADLFEDTQQGKRESPARPPKIPLQSHHHAPSHHQARPTSTMTFMTASTKIGEIPESRLPGRGWEESTKMSYTIPAPLGAAEPKRRKGFKFWKKEAKIVDIAAQGS